MGMPEGYQPRRFLLKDGQVIARAPLDVLKEIAAADLHASPPLRRSLLPLVATHEEPTDFGDMVRQKDLKVIWDFAERAANGLRSTFREPYLTFSEKAANADHPHGHEHGRRVERHTEQLLLEARGISLPTYLIQAAALFPYLHDADQLNTEQRNLDTGKSFPPKHMHGLAGGIQVLAQTAEYAKAAGISLTEARKVTGAAAYIMIKHEEPALLLKALAGTTDPKTVPPADLTAAYDANNLDLTRISSAQLINLLKEKKAQEGFVAEDTPNGLHPVFENAYKVELKALAADNALLLPINFSEDDRKGLQFLTQASVLADVFDMIMPAEESITRKLGVHKSLTRPFFRPEAVDKFMEKVTGESGHFEQEVGSDLLRACWEFMHPLGGIDGELAESPYVKNLLAETVIKGALAFRNVGLALMDGDFGPLEQIYDRRIRTLAEKLLGKVRKTDVSLAGLTQDEVLQELENAHLSQVRIRSLITEREKLVTKITPKFKNSDNSNLYNDDQKAEFRQLISMVTDQLQEQYGIDDERVFVWEKELRTGASTMLPFGSYDSAVTKEDLHDRRRTIFAH